MPSGKIVASVYRIDVPRMNEILETKVTEFTKVAKLIKDKNSYENGWSIVEPKDDLIILYKNQRNPYPWGDFFLPVLNQTHELVKGQNQKMSFVMFLFVKKEIYAICAGLGFHIIKDFVEDHFGMEVFCRLFEKAEVEPSFLKYRGYSGKQILGQAHYRERHKLSYEDDFGRLYSEVVTKLNKDKAKEAFKSVTIDLKQDLAIDAKDSLQLRKTMTLKEVKDLCHELQQIYEKKKSNFPMNRLKRIDSRDKLGKELIDELDVEVKKKVKEVIFDNESYAFELMSPKNPEIFINSHIHQIIPKGHRKSYKTFNAEDDFNFDEVINTFKKYFADAEDEEDSLAQDFLDSRIAFGDNENQLFEAKIKDLIAGEISVKNKKYFRIDRYWYEFDDDFEEFINSEFKGVVKSRFKNSLLKKKWTEGLKEEEFISRNFKSDWKPLHTIKINNVEICDLIKIDDDEKVVYLAHVKNGVDAIVRDVVSQAIISTRMLQADRSSSYKIINSYIKAIQNKAKTFTGDEPETYDEMLSESCSELNIDNLRLALKDYRICTCVCIKDSRKTEKDLQSQWEEFDSNIAKFSLIEFSKTMANYNLDCHVIQIKS